MSTDQRPGRRDAVTLDDDVTTPATAAAGHGPADTTDPREIASSASPRPGPQAVQAGTVNAVVPVGRVPEPRTEWLPTDRVERYQVTGPDGQPVTVEHNLELGDSRVVEDSP